MWFSHAHRPTLDVINGHISRRLVGEGQIQVLEKKKKIKLLYEQVQNRWSDQKGLYLKVNL